MKTYASILLVALSACSRAESAAAERHKGASVRVHSLAHDEETEPQDERDPAHVFPLPKYFSHMTPGEDPSPEHAAGTVYLLAGPAGASTVTIAEWDLASGKAVHRAVLPQVSEYEHNVIANEGGVVHLVNTGSDGRHYYTRLSPELKVLSRTRMDELRGDAKTIASDGNVTVITGCHVWMGAAGPCFVATYDERGAPIAHSSIDGNLQEFEYMHDGAAVVAGSVYLLLLRDGGLHVDEFTRDLTPLTTSIVPVRDEHSFRDSTLRARGGRVVVDDPPALYEFSSDLAEVKEAPRIAPLGPRSIGQAWCQEHVRLGPVDAFGCWRSDTAENFVAWDLYRPN